MPAGPTSNPPAPSNRTSRTTSNPSAGPGRLNRASVARTPTSGTRDRPTPAAFRRNEPARSGGNQYAPTRALPSWPPRPAAAPPPAKGWCYQLPRPGPQPAPQTTAATGAAAGSGHSGNGPCSPAHTARPAPHGRTSSSPTPATRPAQRLPARLHTKAARHHRRTHDPAPTGRPARQARQHRARKAALQPTAQNPRPLPAWPYPVPRMPSAADGGAYTGLTQRRQLPCRVNPRARQTV